MSRSEPTILFPYSVPASNQMAFDMLKAVKCDTNRRTLPATLPGPTVDEHGYPLPENDPRRRPQVFDSFVPIVVDDVVAEALLVYNTMNRNMSPSNVDALGRSMLNGKWYFNGISSTLPCSNTAIMDKQHTLYAVIEAFRAGRERGTPVKPILMIPVIGLDPEAFASIDNGKGRSTKDTLTASERVGLIALDEVPPESMSNALRVTAQYANMTEVLADDHPLYLPNNRARIPNDRVVSLLRHVPELADSLQYCVDIGVTARKSLVGMGVLATLHMLITQVQSETAANQFIRALEFGVKLDEDSPVHRLREQLIRDRNNKKRLEGIDLLAACCRTWNYVACHKNVAAGKRIRAFNSDGSFPEPMPMQRRGSALTR